MPSNPAAAIGPDSSAAWTMRARIQCARYGSEHYRTVPFDPTQVPRPAIVDGRGFPWWPATVIDPETTCAACVARPATHEARDRVRRRHTFNGIGRPGRWGGHDLPDVVTTRRGIRLGAWVDGGIRVPPALLLVVGATRSTERLLPIGDWDPDAFTVLTGAFDVGGDICIDLMRSLLDGGVTTLEPLATTLAAAVA